ncbi:YCF48-related protein [Mariniflexile sp. AS56]|uniref:YCF48-related protein n=1 Tax=Mariniflexile sp. AS56 TaxID=3063957 RepID=UPI0026E99156|nr:YCF48-related protein [Mariniflexile sp. AS56]MDO7171825.1 YCF48-related protein [Mariniflexile sp. AS56]
MRILIYLCSFFCINAFAQATWQPATNIVTNGDNQRFDDIHFINETTGWAANGGYAAVYKTTDGGKNWTLQLSEAMLGGDYYFRSIHFLDENIGFLGTLDSKFFKTSNGGTNWTEVTNLPTIPKGICGLDSVGTSTIYGCGAYFEPAHIIKSTDSGDTWQYIDMSAYATALVEIHFLTEQIGFVGGKNANGATLLKTIDGGATWTELYNSTLQGEYFWKMQVLESNPNVIFGAVEAATSHYLGKLAKSLDGGATWITYNAPEANIQAVGFIDENKGWMGGHTTGFYETLNGGQSWTNLNVGKNLNRIFIMSSTLAYASGATIYKFTEASLGIEATNAHSRTPLKLHIKNNPVDSYLEFDIDFDSSDHILIELYEMNGKFIRQLTRDRILATSIKSYKFSVEDLASGTYLINFHNNTGRESHKFVRK